MTCKIGPLIARLGRLLIIFRTHRCSGGPRKCNSPKKLVGYVGHCTDTAYQLYLRSGGQPLIVCRQNDTAQEINAESQQVQWIIPQNDISELLKVMLQQSVHPLHVLKLGISRVDSFELPVKTNESDKIQKILLVSAHFFLQLPYRCAIEHSDSEPYTRNVAWSTWQNYHTDRVRDRRANSCTKGLAVHIRRIHALFSHRRSPAF